MSKTLFLLALLACLPTLISAQTWQALPDSPTSERFEDIYFVTAELGWTVSKEGKIYKTTNGGLEWREIYSQPDYFFRSLEFLNDKVGIAGTLSRALLRTEDGGDTWIDVSGQLPPAVYGICGLSHVGNTVYGVGVWSNPAYMIKSTDGGKTWTYQDLSALADGLVDVHFFNEQVGLAAGIIEAEGGIILRTTNGGQSWTRVHNTNRGLEYVWKLDFLNDKVGYGSVASFQGNTTIVVKTTNGGKTWTNLDVDTEFTGLQTQGLGFADEKLGWTAPKFTSMYETRDGGQTWTQRDDLDNVNKFFRLNDDLLYASGSYIYKYGEGDTTGQQPVPIPETEVFEIIPNPFQEQLRIIVEVNKTTYAKLDLFDQSGRHLASIYNDQLAEGRHEFPVDARVLEPLAMGVYSLLLRTHGGFRAKQVFKR